MVLCRADTAVEMLWFAELHRLAAVCCGSGWMSWPFPLFPAAKQNLVNFNLAFCSTEYVCVGWRACVCYACIRESRYLMLN